MIRLNTWFWAVRVGLWAMFHAIDLHQLHVDLSLVSSERNSRGTRSVYAVQADWFLIYLRGLPK